MKRIQFSLWYLPAALLLVLLAQSIIATRTVSVNYSTLLKLAEENKIERALVSDNEIRFQLRPGTPITGDLASQVQKSSNVMSGLSPDQNITFVTTRISGLDPSNLVKLLTDHGVKLSGELGDNFWRTLLLGWLLPFGLIMVMWTVIARRMGPGGAAGALSLGRNKAKIYGENDVKVRFSDVAGIDEAKAELESVVAFLKNPAYFQRLGGRIPKGVLLVGPPGTGKTLLARAIAGEAGVPFFSISGSEFIEMFVGLGAARVRDLFEQAKSKAPCIVFIDELDAVGKSRAGAGLQLGRHDEQEQTLNQLLVEMDGFDSSKGVVLLAATNRPEVLDPALLRAGRFDRRIIVELPDRAGRSKILLVHMRGVKTVPGVDVEEVAARTPGFSGADLANLVNEAALLAAQEGAEAVATRHFLLAADRLMTGLERRSRVLRPQDRTLVAHHESGHALVASLLPNSDTVTKVTIIPRSIGALGFTMQLPAEDRVMMRRAELMDRLAIMLGGRVAEEISFGDISTGAQDDLERASQLARQMVCVFGMSDRLGPLSFGRREALFLGDGVLGRPQTASEATAEAIDAEVARIVHEAYSTARQLLGDRRKGLAGLAATLEAAETLEGDPLRAALEAAKVRDADRGDGAGRKQPLVA
ncbi:MAG TPA: ATP-dependent zinc metalloprotease FtsH [Candidatus Binatia bacterium]|nr:ATP-dependent zinc metalloprotease FtsH [Candidatus Binatia bacterium]